MGGNEPVWGVPNKENHKGWLMGVIPSFPAENQQVFVGWLPVSKRSSLRGIASTIKLLCWGIPQVVCFGGIVVAHSCGWMVAKSVRTKK